MTNSLDLIFLPLVRHPEHDQGIVPGLLVYTPPRRAGRGRSEDRLFIHLSLGGNAVLEPHELARLLESAAQIYYKTSGTVTSAIRQMSEALNREILARNIHNSGRGLQAFGFLTVGVLRQDKLYLAQSGPTHALLATAGDSQHLHDAQMAGRGLGLSRTVTVRYLQLALQPGDLMLLSAQPSPAWSPQLLEEGRGGGLESLRRHLIAQVEIDPFAILVQAREGEGRLRMARPRVSAAVVSGLTEEPEERAAGEQTTPAPAKIRTDLEVFRPEDYLPEGAKLETEMPAAALPEAILPSTIDAEAAFAQGVTPPTTRPEEAVPITVEGEAEVKAGKPQVFAPAAGNPAAAMGGTSAPAGRDMPAGRVTPAGKDVPAGRDTPAEGARTARSREPATAPSAETMAERREERRQPRRREAVPPAVKAAVETFNRNGRRLRDGILAFLQRMLPDEALTAYPAWLMGLIAVAIPLVVAAIAFAVYNSQGQRQLAGSRLAEVQSILASAEGVEDSNVLRQTYASALALLEEVERAGETSAESQALRAQVQTTYDQLEWIERVEFQPAMFGTLPPDVIVSQILVVGEDLYLLDAATGRVNRAVQTTRGFEMDDTFSCGPTASNGPLVDIDALPPGNRLNAALVGTDVTGNLLYCVPGEVPYAQALPTPDSNWGKIAAMKVDSETMYVLDPVTNAVWYYPGSGSVFTQRPTLYFDENIPDLTEVIDLAVYRNELFMLTRDSQIIACVSSGLPDVPTRCDNPASFTDARPSRSAGELIEGAKFTQILYSEPPDPSIYMLDPVTRAVYQFSVRLTLQRQYRSSSALPEGLATVFTVSPNRRLYMVLGDQVYYAVLP